VTPMQDRAILQAELPFAPWRIPRGGTLPGTGPCALSDWLLRDDAFAAQMALRDRLLARTADRVMAAMPGTAPALSELLDLVLDWLGADPAAPSYARPDGETVPLDRAQPLRTLGRLVQQDFCLLEAGPGADHVLSAAVLCFPAGWTLAEKLGRPLTAIHGPVADYDPLVARRVQRLFDALRPSIVLQRCNCLAYADPALFAPFAEADPRPRMSVEARYTRLERQTLRRLPNTGAVVFAIHTAMLETQSLGPQDRAHRAAHLAASSGPGHRPEAGRKPL